MTYPSFDRPFPALTPAQRYHLDALGYVVVPNTLFSDEVEEIKAALHRLRGELAQLQDPTAACPRVWLHPLSLLGQRNVERRFQRADSRGFAGALSRQGALDAGSALPQTRGAGGRASLSHGRVGRSAVARDGGVRVAWRGACSGAVGESASSETDLPRWN